MLAGSVLLFFVGQSTAAPPYRIPADAQIELQRRAPATCTYRFPDSKQIMHDLRSWKPKTGIQIDGSDDETFSDCYLEGSVHYHGKQAEFKLYSTKILEVKYPNGDFWWFVPPRRQR